MRNEKIEGVLAAWWDRDYGEVSGRATAQLRPNYSDQLLQIFDNSTNQATRISGMKLSLLLADGFRLCDAIRTMKISSQLLGAVTVAVLVCAAAAPPGAEVWAQIQKQLPSGWTCTRIVQKGKMGHPHGLGEPLFRLDFTNSHLTFQAEARHGRGQESMHPSLRLHFHAQAEREAVLKTIKTEQIYSWDIPVLFGETKEYLVITSPSWQNQGVYTETANAVIAPLLRAVKRYCRAAKDDLSAAPRQ